MVELKSRLGLELSESVSLGAPGMDSSGSISAGAAAAVLDADDAEMTGYSLISTKHPLSSAALELLV